MSAPYYKTNLFRYKPFFMLKLHPAAVALLNDLKAVTPLGVLP
jgi:hypothetical protein